MLSTVTVADAVACLPLPSTIDAAIVCDPSGTVAEFHEAGTGLPSTVNETVDGSTALVCDSVSATCPLTKVHGCGVTRVMVG